MAIQLIENHPFDEINVGQGAEIERTLTRDDIAMFGKVSGDLNPTHFGEEAAAGGAGGGITGHSLWSSALISSLLGNVLPGPGTVYRRQDVEFQRPILLGDTLTARIEVREKKRDRVVLFDCRVNNQKGELVMSGIAEVTAPAAKLQVPRPELPDVSVRHHDSYAALFDSLRGLEPIPTAVVHPCDFNSLHGAIDAAQDGFIVPILVGPENRIRAAAEESGVDLGGFRIVDVEHSHAAAAQAVQLVREGVAELIMKGSLHTDEVLVRGVILDSMSLGSMASDSSISAKTGSAPERTIAS